MSDIDPTFYPPAWILDEQDGEQHKVMTEHGIIDFLGTEVKEVEHRFREAEEWAEQPEEVREFKKLLAAGEKHSVRVRDVSNGVQWEAVSPAVNLPDEVTSGKGMFHGATSPVAAVLTVIDQVSGQASTVNPLGTWGIGPAASPLWLDRGIRFRRGLWIASSVATTISVYWRDWDED